MHGRCKDIFFMSLFDLHICLSRVSRWHVKTPSVCHSSAWKLGMNKSAVSKFWFIHSWVSPHWCSSARSLGATATYWAFVSAHTNNKADVQDSINAFPFALVFTSTLWFFPPYPTTISLPRKTWNPRSWCNPSKVLSVPGYSWLTLHFGQYSSLYFFCFVSPIQWAWFIFLLPTRGA